MAVTFDQNAGCVTAAIAGEIVSSLIRFNAVVASFNRGVCPASTVIIDDFGFPVSHGFQSAPDRLVLDRLPLLTPARKPKLSHLEIRRVIIPIREGFLPLSDSTTAGRMRAVDPTVFSSYPTKNRQADSAGDAGFLRSLWPVGRERFVPTCAPPGHSR